MSTEQNELEHYDNFAEIKKMRDVIPSTRIPREYAVYSSFKPIFARQGSLGTIVDIGCGIGSTAKYLHNRFDRYIGIDFSSEMVAIGKEFNKDSSNVEFIIANVKNRAELPKQVADVVFINGALHHMTDVDAVIQAVSCTAKPGALFVIKEPQSSNLLIQLARKIRMKIDKSYSSDQFFFSPNDLVDLLRRNGLEDVHYRHQGFFCVPLAQIPLYPQWLFRALSYLVVKFEPVAERVFFGPFKKLSWDIIAYARFPR